MGLRAALRASLRSLGVDPDKRSTSDAARILAKQGADKRHARKIEVMNILRAEMGMPRFEVRS